MIADVLYNRKILPAYYRLGIGLKKVPSFKPGQFIMLRITEQVDPLLRRPFGVYRILGSRVKGQGARVKLLFGGKSKDDLPGLEDFKRLKIDMEISTDDGSVGKKGLVTDLLMSELRTLNSELRTVYACGPKEMLKEVARIAEKADAPCYVSLDNVMACGIGACLGCAIKTVRSSEFGVKSKNSQLSTLNSQHYKMVCKEGPVFDAREIEWEAI